MTIFDSHAHYNDDRFRESYPGGAEQALADSFASGVAWILNAGTCVRTSEESIALAERYGQVYASVGLHPEDALEFTEADEDDILTELVRLSDHPKVRAWGEIGLDYHWSPEAKERQKKLFDKQLSIAAERKLPVIIHDREAHGDCLDIVAAHPDVTGVFHSFSGSAEMAKQLSAKGWYISFGGPVTYKNAHKVREAAAVVPDEFLLVETDAPYLPPVPHRGEVNCSAYLPFTIGAIADARGSEPEAIAELTCANAKRFFGIA